MATIGDALLNATNNKYSECHSQLKHCALHTF
jgi:hypothetical protein